MRLERVVHLHRRLEDEIQARRSCAVALLAGLGEALRQRLALDPLSDLGLRVDVVGVAVVGDDDLLAGIESLGTRLGGHGYELLAREAYVAPRSGLDLDRDDSFALLRGARVQAADLAARNRRTEDRGVQHAGHGDVARVLGPARGLVGSVEARVLLAQERVLRVEAPGGGVTVLGARLDHAFGLADADADALGAAAAGGLVAGWAHQRPPCIFFWAFSTAVKIRG